MAVGRISPSGVSATGPCSSPCKPDSYIPTRRCCRRSGHKENRQSLRDRVVVPADLHSLLSQWQTLLVIIVSYSLPCLEFHLPLFNHKNPSRSHVYFAFPTDLGWV